jgi:murein L,D-transpeptidase YafK
MKNAICAGIAAILLGCTWHSPQLRNNPPNYVPTQAVVPIAVSRYHPPVLDSIYPLHGERVLLLDKSDFSIMVYEYSGHWQRRQQMPVAIGRGSGPKTALGDMNTPEGIYKIVDKFSTVRDENHSSYLMNLNKLTWNQHSYIGPNAFGPYALMLDYPNDHDRRNGRTGSGIMLHSVPEDRLKKNATGGCIGLRLSDMERLYRIASIGTKVIIQGRFP